MDPEKPSERLMELALFALDHGVESIEQGGPLVPFAIVEDDGERDLARFQAETLEEGQEQAREHVRATSSARAAVAWDGYLAVEGECADAVLVEAFERGAPNSFVFPQRYRPAGRFKKLATIGNAALADTGEPLF